MCIRDRVDIDGCGVTEQAEHGTLCADPSIDSVSYTHLDVYKRQEKGWIALAARPLVSA